MLPHPRPGPLPPGQKGGPKGRQGHRPLPHERPGRGPGKRFAQTIWENSQLKSAGIRLGNHTGRYDPADPQASMWGTVAAKAVNSLIIIKKVITILKLNLRASRNPGRILWETGEL
jgi:hypothetical protein